MQIKNAYKKFNQTSALQAVNIDISMNTSIGLVGHSGSGKSTLLRCIQKLETLDDGEIHYSGSCGLMFQDFQLFPHFNVLKNLTYAPALKQQKNIHEKAQHLLQKLGIADKALVFPHDLSGGQKQRVALARLLMMDKSILLCDEPTSGLDLASIHDVIRLLKAVRRMPVTLIIASHDVDFITHISDRIIVMSDGRIKADMNIVDHLQPIEKLKKILNQEKSYE